MYNVRKMNAKRKRSAKQLPIDAEIDGLYSITLNSLKSQAPRSDPDAQVPAEGEAEGVESAKGDAEGAGAGAARSALAGRAAREAGGRGGRGGQEEGEGAEDEDEDDDHLHAPRVRLETLHHFNTALLNGVVNDKGRIPNRYTTGLTAKQHRRLKSAIKRARAFGLMSPVEKLQVDDLMSVFTRDMRSNKRKEKARRRHGVRPGASQRG